MHEHVLIIDASYLMHNAYWASQPQGRKDGAPLEPKDLAPDGVTPIYGVRALCERMFWLLRSPPKRIGSFTIAIMAMGSEGRTFRHHLYEGYKQNRSIEEDFAEQKPIMKEAIKAFGFGMASAPGYEGDDVIATYVQASGEAGRVTIMAEDKDLMQLVSDYVSVFSYQRGTDERFRGFVPEKLIGVPEVYEKFGVHPHFVPDAQAIIGDSTDGIPGIPKLGQKAAAELINEFGSIEEIISKAERIRQAARRDAVILHAEQALLSKQLALLDKNIEGLPWWRDDMFLVPSAGTVEQIEFCNMWGMASLAKVMMERR